jgi:hypothetical protein
MSRINLGVGIALGTVIGASLGAGLNNIGLGLGIGMSFGLVIGLIMGQKNETDSDRNDVIPGGDTISSDTDLGLKDRDDEGEQR